MTTEESKVAKEEKMVVLFDKMDKETPGAFRYIEVTEDGAPVPSDEEGRKVGGLYFRRTAWPKGAPKRVRVTIEVVS